MKAFQALYIRYVVDLLAKVFGFLRALPVVGGLFEHLSLTAASCARLCNGCRVAAGVDKSKRPKELLVFYGFEACPHCKLVRETFSSLDLDYLSYPCPKETLSAQGVAHNSRFRPAAIAAGGKCQFPLLVDNNTNSVLYESHDIVAYLWKTYGDQAKPPLTISVLENPLAGALSTLVGVTARPALDGGLLRTPSTAPTKPLLLWGQEVNNFVKLVRERLDSLELPYVVHTTALGATPKRAAFRAMHDESLGALRRALGCLRVPYMEDPNTGAKIFDSGAIRQYLQDTYARGKLPQETWADWGSAVGPTAPAKKAD